LVGRHAQLVTTQSEPEGRWSISIEYAHLDDIRAGTQLLPNIDARNLLPIAILRKLN
jgi:hypothetical protein